MQIPDFEPDADLFGGMRMANEPDGTLLVNAEKAEEFDPRISSDVEGLIFLGRLTKDVTLYGHTFTLKTLTRGERLAVTKHVEDFQDTFAFATALETAFLALSIISCDGRPLTISLSDEDARDPSNALRRNFSIIEKWYDPILEALYVEYSNLVRRQAQALSELEGKSTASRPTS